MAGSKNFFKNSAAVVEAIQAAERATTGEIRVHLEDHCPWEALSRAEEIFLELRMHETFYRNGVLIYIATEDHKMAIVGDRELNKIVGDGFWENEIMQMKQFFAREAFDEGVIQTVHDIGQKLKVFFPAEAGRPENELSDEISFG